VDRAEYVMRTLHACRRGSCLVSGREICSYAHRKALTRGGDTVSCRRDDAAPDSGRRGPPRNAEASSYAYPRPGNH